MNVNDESYCCVDATELIHLTYKGNFQLKCSSTVLQCRCVDTDGEGGPADDGGGHTRVELQLDTTTMHPQGGGQPSDLGTVSSSSTIASIEHVTLDRKSGIATHIGKIPLTSEPFPVGTKVDVSVDTHRRQILSECHTAGHVVDAAMDRCGYNLPASKGYHFLDGPYVEYKGKLPVTQTKEHIIKGLQEAFQELVAEDIPTKIETYSKSEADALCNRLAQNFDMSLYGEEVRIVTVAGFNCPCGGTHVSSTGKLKERGWSVVGLKAKKGVVRVKYNY